MPRSRNIKPSLFKNEILGEADPLLTILFTGLWCLADRDGKVEDRPKRIKAEIFPYRECPDFNGYLTELARLGFIERYEAENTPIIRVLNFVKHQSPHKTEKASDLPDKPLEMKVTEVSPLNNGAVTEEAALIPDLLIPDSCREKAKAKRFEPPTEKQVFDYMVLRGTDGREANNFRDFYASKGWMVGKNKMKDWEAAARRWLTQNKDDHSSSPKVVDIKDLVL